MCNTHTHIHTHTHTHTHKHTHTHTHTYHTYTPHTYHTHTTHTPYTPYTIPHTYHTHTIHTAHIHATHTMFIFTFVYRTTILSPCYQIVFLRSPLVYLGQRAPLIQLIYFVGIQYKVIVVLSVSCVMCLWCSG